MSFPDDALTDEEDVRGHLHPHWHTLLLPGIWAVASVALMITCLIVLPDALWAWILFLLVVALGLFSLFRYAIWPFVLWRTTHFVFTTDRILLRGGVFNRKQRDVPLARLNDVAVHQSFFDQLFGCGALVVGSTGDHGASRLEHIPNVMKVQVLINKLIRESGHRRGADVPHLEKRLMDGAAPRPEPEPT
jgi:uncharacterized membrane protein YdbT with pleckstrin-like domain